MIKIAIEIIVPCKSPNFLENKYVKKKKESIKSMKKSRFAKIGSLFAVLFFGN